MTSCCKNVQAASKYASNAAGFSFKGRSETRLDRHPRAGRQRRFKGEPPLCFQTFHRYFPESVSPVWENSLGIWETDKNRKIEKIENGGDISHVDFRQVTRSRARRRSRPVFAASVVRAMAAVGTDVPVTAKTFVTSKSGAGSETATTTAATAAGGTTKSTQHASNVASESWLDPGCVATNAQLLTPFLANAFGISVMNGYRTAAGGVGKPVGGVDSGEQRRGHGVSKNTCAKKNIVDGQSALASSGVLKPHPFTHQLGKPAVGPNPPPPFANSLPVFQHQHGNGTHQASANASAAANAAAAAMAAMAQQASSQYAGYPAAAAAAAHAHAQMQMHQYAVAHHFAQQQAAHTASMGGRHTGYPTASGVNPHSHYGHAPNARGGVDNPPSAVTYEQMMAYHYGVEQSRTFEAFKRARESDASGGTAGMPSATSRGGGSQQHTHSRQTYRDSTADQTVSDDQHGAAKRPRLVWTSALHKRFVDAVTHLGVHHAVPKTIMSLMNVDGLTRENVASHLQKYRLYLKRSETLGIGEDMDSEREMENESQRENSPSMEGRGSDGGADVLNNSRLTQQRENRDGSEGAAASDGSAEKGGSEKHSNARGVSGNGSGNGSDGEPGVNTETAKVRSAERAAGFANANADKSTGAFAACAKRDGGFHPFKKHPEPMAGATAQTNSNGSDGNEGGGSGGGGSGGGSENGDKRPGSVERGYSGDGSSGDNDAARSGRPGR